MLGNQLVVTLTQLSQFDHTSTVAGQNLSIFRVDGNIRDNLQCVENHNLVVVVQQSDDCLSALEGVDLNFTLIGAGNGHYCNGDRSLALGRDSLEL